MSGTVGHGNDPFSDYERSEVDYRKSFGGPVRACAALRSMTSADFSVISARVVAAREGVPAHCRVAGVVPPEVRYEVNLPHAWNGRFYMIGNGGLAGNPPERRAAGRDRAIANGFATAYTDTGHDNRVEPGGTFAYRNLEKLLDFGFRSVHLTVVTAKRLIDAYYDAGPAFSYWDGCSTGGRQALISAQRFPDDFDGIVAGAPAADYSGLKFSQAWRMQALAGGALDHEEVLALADAIYARCDGIDGLEDGIIDDPRNCDFDVDRDLARCPDAEDAAECFTPAERAALKRFYAPVTIGDSVVYPGHPFGGEARYPGQDTSGWVTWFINPAGPPLMTSLGADVFRYMLYVDDDPERDWLEYRFDVPPDNLAEFRDIVDATDPDLTHFRDRGGKLLSYFGWADQDINPLTMIEYRSEVEATLGEPPDDFFRLFMVPGMFHCSLGPGPNQFDAMTPLINWVERGVAPNAIPAKRMVDEAAVLERPLCAYPARARHDGNGPPNAQESFACRSN